MSYDKDPDIPTGFYNTVLIVNASIFVIYIPFFVCIIMKKELFLSAKVLLWCFFTTFLAKAMADTLRVLLEGDMSPIYYEMT
jgi:hypothetical protein